MAENTSRDSFKSTTEGVMDKIKALIHEATSGGSSSNTRPHDRSSR
jgi:hypothetical protein